MTATPVNDIWVVIPAYNEASAVGRVIGEVRAQGFQVIVVDDGSADATRAAAAAAGAVVARHAVNLGQGASLQTGIDLALSKSAQFILTFDADGQHQADDLHVLLAPLLAHEADFSLGSRFLGGMVGAPLSRRLTLRAATAFTRLTSGMKLTDAHNGLRGMTRRGAQAIRLRQNRMAHASEILDQIAVSGLAYVEVPVTVHYTAYSLQKGQKLGDAVGIVLDLATRSLHR